MEKVWTAPVKATVIFAAVCAVGTPIGIWIGLKNLEIAKQQLQIMEGQRREQPKPPGSPGSVVTISYAPFFIASGLSLLSILTLIGTIFYIRKQKHTKLPNGALAIHSAKWVVSNDKTCFINAAPSLQQHIKESLTDSIDIMLTNRNLGGDPRKDTHKHLRLVYSYGPNGTKQEIFKGEDERLILPETPDEIQKRLSKQPVGDRSYLGSVFTVQDKYPELSSDPHVAHRDVVRMILTNATGKELEVWTPIWESKEVFAEHPFASKVHLYGPAGWKVKGAWDDGHNCIRLPAGHSFMCWIALLEPSGEGLPQRIKKETTGTAVFPVKIEGKLYDVPVRL